MPLYATKDGERVLLPAGHPHAALYAASENWAEVDEASAPPTEEATPEDAPGDRKRPARPRAPRPPATPADEQDPTEVPSTPDD